MRFYELIVKDLKEMSTRNHAYYWIIPLITMTTLMIFYFSGVPELVNFVSPLENREWGFLENLQLFIIFGIFLLSLYAFFKKTLIFQKLGFFFICIFSIFIFLEEMDYGKHFAELIGGTKEVAIKEFIPSKNIHNQGNNARNFKRTVKLLILLIFVGAPLVKPKIKNPYISYLIPQPRILIVAFLTGLAYYVPLNIVALELAQDGGLGINIAEFSEVMIYYVFLIYVFQLAFINQFKQKEELSLS